MAIYAFVLTVVAAALTSFYSWRLIFMTFHGEPRDRHHYEHAHESPLVMLVPLGVLAVGSLFAGYPVRRTVHRPRRRGVLLATSLRSRADNNILDEMHHVPLWVALLPTVMMVARLRRRLASSTSAGRDLPVGLAREHEPLYRFLLNKWYFDELYDVLFVRPAKWLGRFLWKSGDGWLIDGFGPDGVSARVIDVTRASCGCRPAISTTMPSPC